MIGGGFCGTGDGACVVVVGVVSSGTGLKVEGGGGGVVNGGTGVSGITVDGGVGDGLSDSEIWETISDS